MSTHRFRAAAGQQGFTVIELLIAATILLVALLAISGMVPTAYTTVSFSGADSQALAFAQQRLEQLQQRPYSDALLSAGSHSDPDPAAGFKQRYEIVEDPPVSPLVNGLKRLTVTVTGPGNRQVQLLTLLTH